MLSKVVRRARVPASWSSQHTLPNASRSLAVTRDSPSDWCKRYRKSCYSNGN